jgi:dephospho-CoA kinase
MTIIGLTGKKGSGKTTIANYLNKKYNFNEYSLADPLKQIAKIIGFTDTQLYGSQYDKTQINDNLGISSREFLQKFGSEIMRDQIKLVFPNMNLGESGIIWIHLMENYIKQTKRDIVVPDIRFLDEADAIKKHNNSIIININRFVKNDEYSLHVSETELDSITSDYILDNNGSIEDLYKQIDELFIFLKV